MSLIPFRDLKYLKLLSRTETKNSVKDSTTLRHMLNNEVSLTSFRLNSSRTTPSSCTPSRRSKKNKYPPPYCWCQNKWTKFQSETLVLSHWKTSYLLIWTLWSESSLKRHSTANSSAWLLCDICSNMQKISNWRIIWTKWSSRPSSISSQECSRWETNKKSWKIPQQKIKISIPMYMPSSMLFYLSPLGNISKKPMKRKWWRNGIYKEQSKLHVFQWKIANKKMSFKP